MASSSGARGGPGWAAVDAAPSAPPMPADGTAIDNDSEPRLAVPADSPPSSTAPKWDTAAEGKMSPTDWKGRLDRQAAQYKVIKTKIHALTSALKAEHKSMVQLNDARNNVAKRVAELAERSPIEDRVGPVPTEEMTTNWKLSDESDMYSFTTIRSCMSTHHEKQSKKFSKEILDYALEWEKVVDARVSNSMKQAASLKKEFDHYAKKVEKLQIEKGKFQEKGREFDSKHIEKLQRNESKLTGACSAYETYAKDLSIIMEEVITQCWKDLNPLLIALSNFDASLGAEQGRISGGLENVAEAFNSIALEHGVKPKSRLKKLAKGSSHDVNGSVPD